MLQAAAGFPPAKPGTSSPPGPEPARHEAVRTELARVRASLRQAEQARVKAEAGRSEAEAARREAQVRAAAGSEAVAAGRAELDQARAELARLKQMLSRARDEAARVSEAEAAARDRLGRKLAEARSELSAVQRRLQEAEAGRDALMDASTRHVHSQALLVGLATELEAAVAPALSFRAAAVAMAQQTAALAAQADGMDRNRDAMMRAAVRQPAWKLGGMLAWWGGGRGEPMALSLSFSPPPNNACAARSKDLDSWRWHPTSSPRGPEEGLGAWIGLGYA